jgi:hypothetical protein
MQQLNIQYFFPLTEQIDLDLDFKPCQDYDEEQRKKQTYTGYTLNNWNGTGAIAWTTVSTNIGNPSFTINVDQCPITIVSKKKPNFVKQFIYKTLGMKWKAE